MPHRVGYFQRADSGVYAIVRRHLPSGCELRTLEPDEKPEEVAGELDFLIAGSASAALVSRATRLRLIQAPGVGYDKIDFAAARAAGVPVAICQRGSAECVAEYTLLLMLAVSRRLVELHNSLREGRWLMWERRLQSHELRGRTLGVVGMGRIGRAVAERARAFGMEILYHDGFDVPGYRRTGFDELLAASDIVTLHVPLTSVTRGLMGAAQFAAMRPGAYFINAARGELVDEPALIAALRSGQLAGAGLDVFASEPPGTSNPLLSLPQVVVSPHVANGTIEALEDKAAFYGENILRVLRGESPDGLVELSS